MTLRDNRGFTLVELIVSMAIFMFVIMITTDAFNLIIAQASKLMHSEESNIEGMVGLEQFRHDLQQAGFGLPYEYVNADGTAPAPADLPKYKEADDAPAKSFNEPEGGVPRAFTSGNKLSGVGTIINDSDYLVIRGTSVTRSAASQKWTYLRYSSVSPKPHAWPSTSENLEKNDWVIALRRTYSNGQYRNQLILDSSQVATSSLYFSFTYDPTGFLTPDAFNPLNQNTIHYIHGIAPKTLADIRMPFNRTDYFVSRPNSMPASCAPKTGILYKGTINQDLGKTNEIPLMDCIADMQVIYGWDLKDGGAYGNDGLIDTYSNADGTAASGEASNTEVAAALSSADSIRNSLKLVKVFILAQNGKKDPNYTSPASYDLFDDGLTTLGRTYALDNSMRNYRWKVYRIVVRPKNLTSNT